MTFDLPYDKNRLRRVPVAFCMPMQFGSFFEKFLVFTVGKSEEFYSIILHGFLLV